MGFVGTSIDYITIAENVRRDQSLGEFLDDLAQAFAIGDVGTRTSYSDDLLLPDHIEPSTLRFLQALVKQATPADEKTGTERLEDAARHGFPDHIDKQGKGHYTKKRRRKS